MLTSKFMSVVAFATLMIGCSGSPDRSGFDGGFDYAAMRDNPNYRDHPQCPQWGHDSFVSHKRTRLVPRHFPNSPDHPDMSQWCRSRCEPSNCTVQFKLWYRHKRNSLNFD